MCIIFFLCVNIDYYNAIMSSKFLTDSSCCSTATKFGVYDSTNSASVGGNDDETTGGGGGVSDHGALTGLGDDDHVQYALLAGRAAGQTIIGGASAGDDLTLEFKLNAT